MSQHKSYDRYGFLISVIAFVVLLFAVYKGNQSDSLKMERTLVPSFSQPSLLNTSKVYTEHDLRGQYTLVHVWASWCVNCAKEHPVWFKLEKEWNGRLLGLNYKDTLQNARNWLIDNGNPFEDHLYDPLGELGSLINITGSPETIVINPNGYIIYRHQGPITDDIFQARILPLVGDA